MQTNALIGRGLGFPFQLDQQRSFLLTDGVEEIEQAIQIILGTSPGERVMRPTFGSRLHELVFAPLNGETVALATRYVEEALRMWEPRINLLNIAVTVAQELHDGFLQIEIQYEIKATHDQRALVYPFYLIPED